MADQDQEPEARPGLPLWVKAFGVAALGLVLIVIMVLLVGGGDHGPGRHGPSHGRAADETTGAISHHPGLPVGRETA